MPRTKKKRAHPLGPRRSKRKRTRTGNLAGPINHRRGGNPDRLKELREIDLLKALPPRIKIRDLEDGAAEYFNPRPRSFYTCMNCQREVEAIPSIARERAFCSTKCAYSHMRKHGKYRADGTRWTTSPRKPRKRYRIPTSFRMAGWLREMRDPTITPAQAQKLRLQISRGMSEMLDEAEDVVFGKKIWSPTQARVFGMLLAKVLPDLSASHVISEKRERPPEEMSIQELEELVAAQKTKLEHDPDDPSTAIIEQLEHEPREAPTKAPRQP